VTGTVGRLEVLIAAAVAVALTIAGCGGGATSAHHQNPFAFHPSAGQPTVLADPTMRKLFGLVYGQNYPIGDARVLLHDLAHGMAIDVFSTTNLRQLGRLEHDGVLEKPTPFATRGAATAYLAIVRRSNKRNHG
jgi:hypothetical protein